MILRSNSFGNISVFAGYIGISNKSVQNNNIRTNNKMIRSIIFRQQ